jgi:hypothetical protein
MSEPPNRVITRAKNATQHPAVAAGVTKRKRRTAAELAEHYALKAETQKAKAGEDTKKLTKIAGVENGIISQDAADRAGTGKERPRPRPLARSSRIPAQSRVTSRSNTASNSRPISTISIASTVDGEPGTSDSDVADEDDFEESFGVGDDQDFIDIGEDFAATSQAREADYFEDEVVVKPKKIKKTPARDSITSLRSNAAASDVNNSELKQ